MIFSYPNWMKMTLFVLFQTSGSTGRTKLVAHTHKSMVVVRHVGDVEYLNSSNVIYINIALNSIRDFPHSIVCG